MRLGYLGLMLLQVAACAADPSDSRRNQQSYHHHQNPRPRRVGQPKPGGRDFDVVGFLPQSTKKAPPRLPESTSKPAREPRTTVKVPVVTRVAGNEVVQILPALIGPPPDTTGTVVTSLNTTGHATKPPLLTRAISSPSALLSPTAPTPVTSAQARARMTSTDIFAEPVATTAPPPVIPQRSDHPVARTGLTAVAPYSTNKFYSNLFLGGLTSPAYLHPYAVHWVKGGGVTRSWGLSASHIEPHQRVFGPQEPTGAVKYFINPVHIQSLGVSAVELGTDTALTLAQATAFGVMAELRPNSRTTPAIRFPLVQGAGFVTGIFNGATPLIETGVHFKTVTRLLEAPKTGMVKYKIVLEDGYTWLLYAFNSQGSALDLEVLDSKQARSRLPFSGTIQIAKLPAGGEAVYDQACGAYATGWDLSGTASGAVGTYTFNFKKAGLADSKLLMFALPHKVDSFSAATRQGITALRLQTTTKGIATGVLADSWTMEEPQMPTTMGFLPWTPSAGRRATVSAAVKAAILSVAQQEMSQDMSEQSNLDSMYFSGKALAKFAAIVVVVDELLGNTGLAQAGMIKLRAALDRFAENRQKFPLTYESAWGGVVSTASYVTGNPGVDFGNTYYNDHHFHYGYFVYAAAVVAKLDPAWGAKNRAWVNTLVRDYANPSPKDRFFPVYRNFDWFHGHSWAHGLYESLDGNDEESSSEDAMSAYAIKMWGTVMGDANMAARGNLQLAAVARALKYYYLYTKDNQIQPATFVGNKVAGILFENKVDHTTFFGNAVEYIQGIHMIPLMPFSTLTRSNTFVREEWDVYFSAGRIDAVGGGWRGIIMGNLAAVDPRQAYDFFASSAFKAEWLDGGASRTWYMAYAAALGGL